MQHVKPVILFNFLFPISALNNKRNLKTFIKSIFEQEKIALERLNYIFCSDEELLKLNIEFLNHKTLTDIITFPLSEKNKPIISDIYISVERVKENASILNVPFITELHRVIFHGALHLCGYKDKTLSEKKLMRAKENFYLNQYSCFT
jgi:rRNA maturation RNase YbeY